MKNHFFLILIYTQSPVNLDRCGLVGILNGRFSLFGKLDMKLMRGIPQLSAGYQKVCTLTY